MQEKLYFYFTNDLHSHFNNWPRVVSYMKERRNQLTKENISHWLVDIGDHIDRVHPIAEAFLGKANIHLMNDLGYDLVTIGNNEGITLAHDVLYHLYDEAKFQVVCSNLFSRGEDTPHWLKPSVKLKSVGGVRIGVIGLTAPFNAYYHLLDWHVADIFPTLDQQLAELKGTVDIIILLSHLGIHEDRQIAELYPEIDVIIGGHTHHLLETEEVVRNTMLTSAGKHCHYVGEVMLVWDHKEKKLIDKKAQTHNVTHLPMDDQTVQMIDGFQDEAEKILSQSVVYTPRALEVDWYEQTPLIKALTNTLLTWTDADCAMLNAGLILHDLGPGNITKKDIHQACPHPINPCVVELQGDELMEVIRASITKEFMEYRLIGYGFRGKIVGKMVFAGLEIAIDEHKNKQEYIKSVTFKGEPLQSDKVYRVATADMFIFGNLLPEIVRAKTKILYLPEYMRDLLAFTLTEKIADILNE